MPEPKYLNEHKWNGIVTAGEQESAPKNNIQVYKKEGKQLGSLLDDEDEKDKSDDTYRLDK